MTTYETVISLADTLSLLEQARLIEHLSTRLRLSMEQFDSGEQAWDTFVQRTYGSTAENPIQRWEQGDYETREPLE